MRPQDDLRSALVGIGLPLLFVLGCSSLALLMWLLAPRRFRASRLLLCLPLAGMLTGFPVGVLVESRPGLFDKMRYGAFVALWLGSSCTTFFMVIGFGILGIASLVKAAASGPEPARRRKVDVKGPDSAPE